MPPHSEDDKLTQRIKRYASVSTKLTGVATRILSQRYRSGDTNDAQMAQNLKAVLGGLKGPLMKIAQLLSTIPDALPPEYAKELAHLQAQAPPMGWAFVKRRMMTELGPDWQKKFKAFTHNASAAASLGQVHKATDLKGNTLACKLQYPDMASVVEADLKQLKLIMTLYETYDRAISTKEIHKEIGARLREELDYELEGRHIDLYAHMLKKEPGVRIPKVTKSLSTKRLLSMTWLEGQPLMQVKDRPLKDRNEIARHMFRAWYVPFYTCGVIHGDPHLGNYSFTPDNAVNLMDFGCLRKFPASFVKGVIDLYRALETNNEDLAVAAYESWGFENISRELIDVLNLWARYLYDPLMENRIRPIAESENGLYGRDVAAKVHDALRKIGGVKPPREFVFMDRAAVGLGSVFLHLQAELNWYQEFHHLITDFSPDQMTRRQNKVFARFDIAPLA